MKEDKMFCPKCGHQNDSNAKFCMGCGKPLTDSEQNRMSTPQPTSSRASEPGRGGLILTFGILSLTLLGPILGIPAWIMGHRDLKKINAGIIAISQKGLTKGGMICGIVGTFFSPFIIIIGIAIAVGLSLFTANSIQANKDAMINDLNNIAANAYQYKIRPESMGGGGNSFSGFRIPSKMVSNDNAKYYAQVISSTNIKLAAVSSQNADSKIYVSLSEDGNLYDWTFKGDFK
jgi:hypothetical protein